MVPNLHPGVVFQKRNDGSILSIGLSELLASPNLPIGTPFKASIRDDVSVLVLDNRQFGFSLPSELRPTGLGVRPMARPRSLSQRAGDGAPDDRIRIAHD